MSKYCSKENGTFFGKTHSEETKKKLSESKKGENNPMFGKISPNRGITPKPLSDEAKLKISDAHKGKIVSSETKQKISIAAKGKPKSIEHKRKLSEANTGKTASQETRSKLSEAHKGKKQKLITCPHCLKSGGTTMHRWHFDNCKSK